MLLVGPRQECAGFPGKHLWALWSPGNIHLLHVYCVGLSCVPDKHWEKTSAWHLLAWHAELGSDTALCWGSGLRCWDDHWLEEAAAMEREIFSVRRMSLVIWVRSWMNCWIWKKTRNKLVKQTRSSAGHRVWYFFVSAPQGDWDSPWKGDSEFEASQNLFLFTMG